MAKVRLPLVPMLMLMLSVLAGAFIAIGALYCSRASASSRPARSPMKF